MTQRFVLVQPRRLRACTSAFVCVRWPVLAPACSILVHSMRAAGLGLPQGKQALTHACIHTHQVYMCARVVGDAHQHKSRICWLSHAVLRRPLERHSMGLSRLHHERASCDTDKSMLSNNSSRKGAGWAWSCAPTCVKQPHAHQRPHLPSCNAQTRPSAMLGDVLPTSDFHALPTPDLHALPTPNLHALPTPDLHALLTPDLHALPTPNLHALPTPNLHALPSNNLHALLNPDLHALPTPNLHALPTPNLYALPSNNLHALLTPNLHALPTPNLHALLTPELLERCKMLLEHPAPLPCGLRVLCWRHPATHGSDTSTQHQIAHKAHRHRPLRQRCCRLRAHTPRPPSAQGGLHRRAHSQFGIGSSGAAVFARARLAPSTKHGHSSSVQALIAPQWRRPMRCCRLHAHTPRPRPPPTTGPHLVQ